MSGVKQLKEVPYAQDPTASILKHMSPGVHLRLRENVCRQVREREWIFNGIENNLLFLIHEGGAYGLIVGIQDIDWDQF